MKTTRVYFDGSQTIPKLYPSKMTFNSVSWDEEGQWDVVNNKIQIQKAGKYLVTAGWSAANPPSTAWLSIFIVKNGIDNVLENRAGVAGSSCSVRISDIMDLIEGDYLELFVVYFSSSNGVTYGGSNCDYLQVTEIGAATGGPVTSGMPNFG